MHRAPAAVGDPPDRAPPHGPALPRVPRGDGAPRMDPHTTQRAPTALTTGTYLLLFFPTAFYLLADHTIAFTADM